MARIFKDGIFYKVESKPCRKCGAEPSGMIYTEKGICWTAVACRSCDGAVKRSDTLEAIRAWDENNSGEGGV